MMAEQESDTATPASTRIWVAHALAAASARPTTRAVAVRAPAKLARAMPESPMGWAAPPNLRASTAPSAAPLATPRG